ncbi:MAG: alpha-amylase family glycosyl hydrolase [Actinomycetes bacterium]
MRRTPSALRPLLAAAAAIAIGAATVVSLGAAPASSADRTVTLAGSLQSELGCPGDWQPGCAATHLPRVSGTTYSTTVTVPPGSYEYKIAINDDWPENYGQDGVKDGKNYLLVLTHDVRLVFTYDDATHRVTVVPADPAPSRPVPSDKALAKNSLRQPLTRERFYFVMADRFANGSHANDQGGLTGDRDVTGYDPTGKGWYHGGDITGLTSKLDYIKNLGTTAIWLTPSFKNRPVQGTGANKSAGYHGYWITDFTQVDPHFGSNAQLSSFIAKAHRKGMKVFFDIITNHTADVIDYAQKQYSYVSKADQPYRDAQGTPFDDRTYVGGSTFPALDPATSFPYTPVFDKPEDATVKVPAWLNDRTLYHNRGDSTFSGENSQYGDFAGLDDLFTEQPKVVKGMTDIYKTWVDFGIDGFRIDTVKHVNTEFWQQFAPAIQHEANRIGNKDFFSFGEVYDASPEFMSTYTTDAKLPATLDFGFQDKSRRFDQGKKTDELRDFFAKDDYYTDTDSNAYELPTFLGNHDMGRVGNFIKADYPAAAPRELLKRDQLLHSLMYFTRGQPVVYYGDEQGFIGDGSDQDARQDMFASQVATYNDDPMIGTTRLGSRARYDQAAPMYRYIAGLSRLVGKNPALRDGAMVVRHSEDSAGVFAFSRIDRRSKVEYVVALNNSTTDKTVTLPTYSSRMRFRGLWPRGLRGTVSGVGKDVTVTVPALSARVWKADDSLARRTAAPGISFVTPEPGGTVGGRAEIGVAADRDAFSQVSFAYRTAGSTAWTLLGTDDNAPYRVFQDVGGMAKGTLLEYRAVLKDSSGNLTVAGSSAVVGDPPPPPEPAVTSVTVPGSLNTEMGCASDWMPDCVQAHLTKDAADGTWRGSFALPAGDYEYKIAINDSWDVNYGADGTRGGGNITMSLPANATVTFVYDPVTHRVTATS